MSLLIACLITTEILDRRLEDLKGRPFFASEVVLEEEYLHYAIDILCLVVSSES